MKPRPTLKNRKSKPIKKARRHQRVKLSQEARGNSQHQRGRRSKSHNPLTDTHPLPLVLFGPPDIYHLLEILLEAFQRRHDTKGYELLRQLCDHAWDTGLETELIMKWNERRQEEETRRVRKEVEKLDRQKGEMLNGLLDPNALAERAVQLMLWTDIQRAAPVSTGAPEWERFEVRDEDGKTVRLLPRGSDEMRRLAQKCYLLKDNIRTHLESQTGVERMRFLNRLAQTPPTLTLLLNLKGRIKPQRLPSPRQRKEQYVEVSTRTKALYGELKYAIPQSIPRHFKETFPELSDLPDGDIPPPRQHAKIAKLILSKRWGVTLSTVETRLKR